MLTRKFRVVTLLLLALLITSSTLPAQETRVPPRPPTGGAIINGGTTQIDKSSGVNRPGVEALAADELTLLVNATVSDARYQALGKKVQELNLFLDVGQAKGFDFAEGYRGLFIPLLDNQDQNRGFLASGGDTWTISLLAEGPARGGEGFEAKMGVDNEVTLNAPASKPKPDPNANTLSVNLAPMNFTPMSSVEVNSSASVITDPTTTCMYVSKLSLSFACWSLPDNPFGYYYVWTYHYGTTPDPISPSWRACYWGSIHVCPRYDSGVMTFPVCGFPPSHASGG
jgi:hypothetical protein